jgi:hypothetical protein
MLPGRDILLVGYYQTQEVRALARLVRGMLPINMVLFAIGLADLVTTLFWLHTGRAIEVNPLMAAVLDTSVVLFVAVKLATLVAYVAVMEWYRRFRSPAFARLVGNVTVASYSAIYSVSFVCVNHSFLLG